MKSNPHILVDLFLQLKSFLCSPHFQHFLIQLTVIALETTALLIGAVVLYKGALIWFRLREERVLLEITPPKITESSSYSTSQLFTQLFSLLNQRSFTNRIFGIHSTLSLELVSTRENGIRFLLQTPKILVSSITKTLTAYLPGLSVREVPEYLGAFESKEKVLEFGQKSHFSLPLLETLSLTEHDPLSYLTGVMTKLKHGEVIAMQLAISPLSGKRRRETLRIKYKIKTEKFLEWSRNLRIMGMVRYMAVSLELLVRFLMIPLLFLAEMITGRDTKLPDNVSPELVATPAEKELETLVKSKLEESLFESSLKVLIKTEATSKKAQENGIKATLMSLKHPMGQELKAKKYLGLKFVKSLKYWQFKSRLNSKNLVLSTSELSTLFHFPVSSSCQTEDLVRNKNMELPAPLPFKHSGVTLDNTFAVNAFGGSEVEVGLTLNERRRHMYILGSTGSGKTTLMTQMIYEDLKHGKGLAVIDPHGQLVEQILAVIPEERIKDVVWFAPDDDAWPMAINLLELKDDPDTSPSQLQKQKSLVASSINSIFQKFYDAKYFGPRMEYVLRNAILTALETPDPTLITILDLLTKTKFRKSVVKGLENQVLKDFWTFEFEKLGVLQRNQMVSPITNKIGGLLSSPINYNILKAPKSKLDFEEIMNSGKILLCDLSKGKIGEDETSFFGSLVIAKLQLAALKRISIPESERRDFFLYVDEFQNFATTTFGELVSEARKYRLSTILAHQSISQIENRDIVKVILANVGTVLCFRTANPEDEQFILPIFAPEVLKHDISNLPLYHFYMKISVGEAQDAFRARVNEFMVEGNPSISELAVKYSRDKYGVQILQNPPKKPIEKVPDKPQKVSKTKPLELEIIV